MSGVDLLISALLTLVVHATALLGAVWLAERAGALKHAGWAEFAWRAALLGALLSTSLQVARWWPDLATAPQAVAADVRDPNAHALTPIGAATPPTPVAPIVDEASAAAPESAAAARTGVAPTSRFTASTSLSTPAAPTATPAPTRRLFAVPDAVALALLAAWLLAMSVGALRLAAQAASVGRLARRSRRHGAPAPDALRADAEHAAAVLAVAPPSLHLLAGVASPMLLPGRRLLLPTWVPALSSPQRRALLAHELAHLQRRDPAWRVLQRLAALPLCFHPLAWHALARLDALAEDACDARAARLAGSGRPLAECLAACLAHAGPRRAPVLAVAMADRPGPVVRRVRNLLEKTPMSDRPVSPLMRRSAIALGIALAVIVPGVAVTTFAAEAVAGRMFGELNLSGDEHFRYSNTTDDYKLQMEVRGKVAYNDAETDIARLEKGAKFALVEEKDGVEREVQIFGKNGVIQHEYRVDGDIVPFEGEGRAWLATMLPQVIRETGIDADARGQRILAKGGTPALLAEIGKIRGDHSRGAYLGVLFAHATLDEAQTVKALALAKEIESDFELRNALQAAVGEESFPRSKLPLVLDAARAIDSDFELAELLSTVAESQPLDAAALPAWRAALAQIGSDFEHRRVLETLLERGAKTPGLVVLALDAAIGIDSDFELRQVLETAAPMIRGDAAATDAWFRAAAEVGSDFELRSALNTVIEAGKVDIAFADRVLRAVAVVDSDFEAREVLVTLAEHMPDDVALRERYRAQARGLGDYERGQAEKALDRFASN